MKRSIISLAVFASTFFVGPLSNAQARQCSNTSLHGGYGFHGIATIAPAGTPRAILGLFTLDGKGTFSSTLTVNDNGVIRRTIDSGTYTVNADCTGTILPVSGGAVEIVVVDSGREFYQMRTDPSAIVLYGVTKRVFRHDDE
jgi:hypothetical protein